MVCQYIDIFHFLEGVVINDRLDFLVWVLLTKWVSIMLFKIPGTEFRLILFAHLCQYWWTGECFLSVPNFCASCKASAWITAAVSPPCSPPPPWHVEKDLKRVGIARYISTESIELQYWSAEPVTRYLPSLAIRPPLMQDTQYHQNKQLYLGRNFAGFRDISLSPNNVEVVLSSPSRTAVRFKSTVIYSR